MSKVDWSLAPDWCKGFGLIGISKFEVWFDDHYYEYLHDGKKHKFNDGCTYKISDISFVENRQQLKQWSGPQDGLPPVGMLCEHSADSNECDSQDGEWFKVEIIAHHRFQEDDYVCAVWVRDAEISYSSAGDHFRALKAPEQIVNDARETAIREIMDVADVDCRVTAARLVDAGFKREGV